MHRSTTNHFIEMVTKRISSYIKEVGDGHQVPTWNTEEVEELVTFQVYINASTTNQ